MDKSNTLWQISQMINSKHRLLKRPLIGVLFITIMIFVITGCYTIRVFHDTDMLREKNDGEINIISIPFTGQQIVAPTKVRSVCPSGASLVVIEQTVTDGLAHYLSLGFYSPKTIKFWCKRRIR